MRHFAFFALLLMAEVAQAELPVIGTIVSASGADTTNATTAAPFVVPPQSKITLWCNAAAFICTDDTTACSATRGLPVVASEKFPTSVGTVVTLNISNRKSAIVRIFGVAAVSCYLFQRTGSE